MTVDLSAVGSKHCRRSTRAWGDAARLASPNPSERHWRARRITFVGEAGCRAPRRSGQVTDRGCHDDSCGFEVEFEFCIFYFCIGQPSRGIAKAVDLANVRVHLGRSRSGSAPRSAPCSRTGTPKAECDAMRSVTIKNSRPKTVPPPGRGWVLTARARKSAFATTDRTTSHSPPQNATPQWGSHAKPSEMRDRVD